MASKKRKGVGQIMDDGTFIFTAYRATGKKIVETIDMTANATVKATSTHYVLTVKFPLNSTVAERYEILRRAFPLVLTRNIKPIKK